MAIRINREADMRSTKLWIALASLLSPTPIVAQLDTTFKNVEYLAGSSAMQAKVKGILVVSGGDVRLVDKKYTPYLIIPVAAIQTVEDGQSADASNGAAGKAKKELLSRSGLGFLSGGGSKQKLIISTRDTSGVEEVIEFKIHEQDAVRQIRARISSQVSLYKVARRAAGHRTSARSDQESAGETPAADTAQSGQPAEALYVLVANPFTSVASDSTAAVEIGNAIRGEVKAFMGAKAQVVTREQMNTVLASYGYPADALLDSVLTATLAKAVQASVMIAGTMMKDASGKYTVTASLAVVGGGAGTPVTVVQQTNETLANLGRRVGEMLKGK